MSQNLKNIQIHLENLTTISKAKAFLGREFLTWVWYLIEKDDGQLEVQSVDGSETFNISLWIDDRAVLESSTATTHSHTIRGGEPSQSPEVAAALKSGKSVKEIKIGINADGVGEFTAILDSDGLSSNGLSPKSLQMPSGENEESDDALDQNSVAIRLDKIETFLQILDGLFARFLSERMDKAWEKKGLKQIQSWIGDRWAKTEKYLH